MQPCRRGGADPGIGQGEIDEDLVVALWQRWEHGFEDLATFADGMQVSDAAALVLADEEDVQKFAVISEERNGAMRVEGLVALVTGGASGLGRACVEILLEGGAKAVICDLPKSPGEAVGAELGQSVAFAPTDVTNADQVQAAVDLAVERFGGLHIAVNCAGIGWAQRTVSRSGPHDLKVFELVIRVNLIGTFNVTRLAAHQMSSQEPIGEERGVIVNTASVAAFDGQIGQAAYASSKGGVVSMTLPVARDLAPRLIRVMTIAPGTFDTPMLAGLPEEARQKLVEEIPHPHRLGKPAEFAALVRHIVENPMLNGETIRLDGAIRMPPR